MRRITGVLLAVLLAGSWLVLPAVPAQASAKVVQRLKVDVDGDGHADTVRVYRLSAHRFRISVVTRRKTVSAIVTTVVDSRGVITDPLYAAARLDPVKGSELILTQADALGSSGLVLTWRSGRLVREKGPELSGGGTTWQWGSGGDVSRSYHFSTVAGRRYVDATELGFSATDPDQWVSATVRSQWRSGAWRYLSTRTDGGSMDDWPSMGADFSGVTLVEP